MTKPKAPSVGPKPPPRTKVCDIIKRYLKPDQSPVWSREIPLWYTLWKSYPSLPFWEKHTLGFKLNSLAWFMSIQGKITLASDYSVFHYQPAPIEAPPVLDTTSQPGYNDRTEQPKVEKPGPDTVAGFLSKQ